MSQNLKLLTILFKLFLLVIIPISLIIYIVFKGMSFEGVLAIIAYFQFLLIWSQAEIGLKQHVLFSAQFDPSFELHPLHSSPIGDGCVLTIKNTSKNTAYHLKVIRVLEESNAPIMPIDWADKISSEDAQDLKSDLSIAVCTIKDLKFLERKKIELFYYNQYGDVKTIQVFFSNNNPHLIPQPLKEPGILLNTFREIGFLPFIIKYKFFR